MNPYRKNLRKISQAYQSTEAEYAGVVKPDLSKGVNGDIAETYVGMNGAASGFDEDFNSKVDSIMEEEDSW